MFSIVATICVLTLLVSATALTIIVAWEVIKQPDFTAKSVRMIAVALAMWAIFYFAYTIFAAVLRM